VWLVLPKPTISDKCNVHITYDEILHQLLCHNLVNFRLNWNWKAVVEFNPTLTTGYATVNKACTKHPRSHRRLATPPSECQWIAVLARKMDLLTQWPWPSNPKAYHLQVYPKVIPYTKFQHFGIICFWVMLRKNRQTDRQTNRRHRVCYPHRPTGNSVVSSHQVYVQVSCDSSCCQRQQLSFQVGSSPPASRPSAHYTSSLPAAPPPPQSTDASTDQSTSQRIQHSKTVAIRA